MTSLQTIRAAVLGARGLLAPTLSTLCLLASLAACGARSDLAGQVPPSAGTGASTGTGTGASGAGGTGATCPPGGPTAYVMDDGSTIYTFDPGTLETSLVDTVSCPTNASPWTMTVAGDGAAYVIYDDWNVYRVDLATGACTQTPYAAGQLGFTGEEGVAVARVAGVERFFVYGESPAPTLGVSDLTSFVLSEVGPANPAPSAFPVAVQGDGAGHLYALSPGGSFFEMDATTAQVTTLLQTSLVDPGNWAILLVGAQIYFFGNGGAVSRFDPVANQLTALGSVGFSVIGASAAPCVP